MRAAYSSVIIARDMSQQVEAKEIVWLGGLRQVNDKFSPEERD